MAAICLCQGCVYNPNVSRLSSLYRLQELDLELDKLNVRLDEIEAILQDSSEVARLQQAAASAEGELRSARNAAQSAEHAVQGQREKIKGTQSKLYGGKVQNPKQLQDLQAEEQSLKRHLDTLEDRYLEAMLAQDEAQQAYDRLDRELQGARAAQSQTHADLVAEREQIQSRRADLKDERQAALATVSESDKRTYEKLREQMGGIAIARLKDDSCSECGLTLSAATQQIARAGNELARCSQCHRLLYGG